MSIIEELVRNILETRFENFSKDIVEHAKKRITDVVGCMIGGANAPGCQMVVDLVEEWGGKKECTVPVHAFKGPAHNVAMVNSVMCRSFDFEPVGPYVEDLNISAHISGTTVPTALAMAELKRASGKELITALILGDDITSRILAASGNSSDLGWDGTGIVNMFGSTAIAGRLLKLNESQMLNAFGIVINQMAGSFQSIYDATHAFKLPIGLASRAGIFSAELASKGFTGVRDPLLSKHGYYNLYCQEYDPEMITQHLGKKFYSDSIIKPYPSCRITHASIDCSLELVHKYNIEADNIEEIIVSVSPGIRDMVEKQPFEIGDFPQGNATFSLQYNIANALLRKSVKLEHFTEEYIKDKMVATLASKVKAIAAIPPEKFLASALEVRMEDGTNFAAYVEIPKGDIRYNPLTEKELKTKFRTNVNFSQTISSKQAEKVLGMIESLEEVKDTTEIINEIS
jgi:2-methylcitrate dehydratase PrpD